MSFLRYFKHRTIRQNNVSDRDSKISPRFNRVFRSIASSVVLTYFFSCVIGPAPANAQTLIPLPSPGVVLPLSQPFTPVLIKGLVTHPDNPLRFEFLIDQGQESLSTDEMRRESLRLIKYFLAALTIPEDEMWVNLSPHEADRVIPDDFSQTDMGRDLLTQDYILKQVSASLSYPEEALGKRFWEALRLASGGQPQTQEDANKIWIVPERAQVYVRDHSAFITDSSLDVMMNRVYQRYVTGSDAAGHSAADAYTKVFQEILLPSLKEDVNYGRNFARLRQIFHSVILAAWFKKNLRQTILGQRYIGKNMVEGITIEDRDVKERVYQQYLEAFRQGVYNYIREEYDPGQQTVLPRQYFSGGIEVANFTGLNIASGGPSVLNFTADPEDADSVKFDHGFVVSTEIQMGEKFPAEPEQRTVMADMRSAQITVDAEDVRQANQMNRNPERLSLSNGETREKTGGADSSDHASVAVSHSDRPSPEFRWTQRIKAVMVAGAMLFSSLLVSPALNAATFEQNSDGRLVAVVQEGDTVGRILQDIRVAYKESDPQQYRTSDFAGPLWGEKGAVQKTGFDAVGDREIFPGQRIEIPASTITQKTMESLTGSPIPMASADYSNASDEESDSNDGLVSASVSSHHADVFLQNGSSQPSDAQNDPLAKKHSSSAAPSSGFTHFSKMIDRNGLGWMAPIAAFLMFLMTFFKKFPGVASQSIKKTQRDAQKEDIKQRLITALPVEAIIAQTIKPLLEKFEDNLAQDFIGKISTSVDLSTADQELIRRKFSDALGAVLESEIRQRIRDDAWMIAIQDESKNIFARDLTDVTIKDRIQELVNDRLSRTVAQSVKAQLRPFQKEIFENLYFLPELKLKNDLYITQMNRESASTPAEYAGQAADAMMAFIREQILNTETFQIPAKASAAGSRQEGDDFQAYRRQQQRKLIRYDSLVALITGIAGLVSGQDSTGVALSTGLAPIIYRVGIAVSLWLHELGHIVRGLPSSLTWENIRGHVSLRQWVEIFVPFIGRIPNRDELYVHIPGVGRDRDMRIRRAGVWVSLGVAAAQLAGTVFLGTSGLGLMIPLTAGGLWTLKNALTSDLLSRAPRTGYYGCGVCAMVKGRTDDMSKIASMQNLDLFRKLIKITDIRGRQAAGVKTMAKTKGGKTVWVGSRMVNTKRGNLPKKLDQLFRKKLIWAQSHGLRGVNHNEVYIGHDRYGTSSAPKKNETHPHQWMPDRVVELWTIKDGQWMNGPASLGTVIAHNGDFESFRLYGQEVPNGILGLWLERVLQTPNKTEGDSPKIAGMMDFLLTQGMWDASVRLAYYLEAVTSVGQVFGGQDYSKNSPNMALMHEKIAQIAQIFQEVMAEYQERFNIPSDLLMRDILTISDNQTIVQDMQGKIRTQISRKLSGVFSNDDTIRRFVETAVTSFFENDLYMAVRKFFDGASDSSNTFGLAVSSSLKTDGMVVAAKGQPLAMGITMSTQRFLIGSEPASVKVSNEGDISEHRFVLDQRHKGEIVEISRNIDLPGWMPLTVYSNDLERELSVQEITDRYEELVDNPYITPEPQINDDDPIGDDLKAIPAVLEKIKNDWDDHESFNVQTADHMLLKLTQKMIEKQVMKTSRRYAQISVDLDDEARKLAVQWVERLSPVLRALFSSDTLQSGLLNKFEAQLTVMLSRYARSVLEQFWQEQRHTLNSVLHRYTLPWAASVLSGKMDEDRLVIEIQDFLQNNFDAQLKQFLAQSVQAAEQDLQTISPYLEKKISLMGRLMLAGNLVPEDPQDLFRTFKEHLAAGLNDLGLSPHSPVERKAYDVMISGIEISLWMGEQFASDLRRIFPDLKIGVTSANKVLADHVEEGLDDQTLVLMISQSGQTFGSLNAVISVDGQSDKAPEAIMQEAVEKMEALAPGQIFVLTGEVDTLMGRAVGQTYKKGSMFGRRILSNLTGFRPAEASSLTGVATHATLTELLLHFSQGLYEAFPQGRAFDQQLDQNDLSRLRRLRQTLVEESERVTGFSRQGEPIDSNEYRQIIKSALRWTRHVLDVPIVKVINWFYLFVAVVLDGLFVHHLVDWMALPIPDILTRTLEFGFFVFFATLMTWGKRLLEKRTILARIGNRNIVIGGPSYFHQTLEIYISKLFSLSKASTSVDVHGANPADHFVHRFGHRGSRGGLIWMGIPDGRLKRLKKRLTDPSLMTAKQAMGVRNFDVGPEVVSIGRDRPRNKNAASEDIMLSGGQADVDGELMEMLYFNRFDSLLHLISGHVFFYHMARKVATLGLPKSLQWIWPWRWDIHRTQSGTRIATTASPQSPSDSTAKTSRKKTHRDKNAPGETYVSGSPNTDGASVAQGAAATMPGGIDLTQRWLEVEEFIADQQSSGMMIHSEIPVMPVGRVTPHIIDIQPLTPITVNLLLGLSAVEQQNAHMS